MNHPTMLNFATGKDKHQTWSSTIEQSRHAYIQMDVSDAKSSAKSPRYQASISVARCTVASERPNVVPDAWHDLEYRQAIVEAGIEEDIAWQILNNRQLRNWTQKQLAEKLGTQQSAVRRLEDPDYGRHSLKTLVKVAHAFDCALQVRLLPFSELAQVSEDLSPKATYAASFLEEFPDGN